MSQLSWNEIRNRASHFSRSWEGHEGMCCLFLKPRAFGGFLPVRALLAVEPEQAAN
jgi:hypothetical protein